VEVGKARNFLEDIAIDEEILREPLLRKNAQKVQKFLKL